MKIYLISQEVNDDYDTYDAFVVIAENEEKAKLVHPLDKEKDYMHAWVKDIKDIRVRYLGEAVKDAKEEQVLGSYNAG